MATKHISFEIADEDLPVLKRLIAAAAGGDRNLWLHSQILASDEQLRQERIAKRRAGMEALHAEMLQQRGGKVYSSDETLALIEQLRVP